jgi:hypothetical protein
VVGRVAADDAVANAVVSASRDPAKNRRGPMPPSTRTNTGYTTNVCSSSAASTVAT